MADTMTKVNPELRERLVVAHDRDGRCRYDPRAEVESFLLILAGNREVSSISVIFPRALKVSARVPASPLDTLLATQ